MAKEILMLGDIEIEKNRFYHHKTPILLRDIDTEKVLVSNKIPFGEKNCKYFIGYLHGNHKVKPLHIIIYISNSFLISAQTLYQLVLYFSNKSSSSIKKYIYLVCPFLHKHIIMLLETSAYVKSYDGQTK